MSILPKAICRFRGIPIKLPMTFFTELDKKILICMVIQKTLNSQSNPEEEKWSWRNQAPQLQSILQGYGHQNSIWYWHSNRHIDQWNRTESPEITPSTYDQFMTNEARTYNGEKTVSSMSGAGKTTATCKRMKLKHSLTPQK